MKYLTRSFLLLFLASVPVLSAADPVTWNLWPGEAPGETVTLPPESYRVTHNDRLAAGKQVKRLQNVSVPTLTIYKPDPKIDTGASVMIAPGGGFKILAFDKEGTEVAEWATSIGLTAIVLKGFAKK
jgi:hypothetical protein